VTIPHEAAYGSLLLERRRGLHARLVEALEALALSTATELYRAMDMMFWLPETEAALA